MNARHGEQYDGKPKQQNFTIGENRNKRRKAIFSSVRFVSIKL